MAISGESLSRRTTSESVASKLRSDILRGALEPGTRLRQGEVAARFGVSTTPVREAFALLQADGLVRIDPHRGAIVFHPSVDDVREFYEIREALEVLAVELSMASLSDELLDRLQELIDEMGTTTDQERWTALNEEFHRRMYQVSGRTRLCDMIANLRNASSAYIHMYVAHQTLTKRANHEHQEILDSCRARDLDRAQAAVRNHLRHTVHGVVEFIERTEAGSITAR
jgi:DNA-binding GntR family transcriptional regulator